MTYYLSSDYEYRGDLIQFLETNNPEYKTLGITDAHHKLSELPGYPLVCYDINEGCWVILKNLPKVGHKGYLIFKRGYTCVLYLHDMGNLDSSFVEKAKESGIFRSCSRSMMISENEEEFKKYAAEDFIVNIKQQIKEITNDI